MSYHPNEQCDQLRLYPAADIGGPNRQRLCLEYGRSGCAAAVRFTHALQTLGKVEVQVNFEGIVCRRAGKMRLRNDHIAVRRNTYRPAGDGSPVWVRDITLTVGAEAVVAARCIVSARDSRASWKSLRTLAARPLGNLLYNDPAISRSKFAYASFPLAATPFVDLEFVDDASRYGRAWARVSEFRRGQAPLVLTEIFLPALWSMIDQK